ncbi:MAG: exo-alpha-sialidase [Acidobacteria bacterium]|nr:exo-alpha-sialidase [Acidobacteriota bacterium]
MRTLFFGIFLLPLIGADVFVSGQDGYHTYRIPAMVKSKKNTLLAFAEGRKDNSRDWGNIDLLVKRSRDGGRTWSPAITVADMGATRSATPRRWWTARPATFGSC